ncbi:MAG TPA: hypothetical protein VMW08_02365 [Acidimicrobiales bacterium]|nr:hypothetical protein [Acidimicrobiales bacterium]
MDSRAVIAAGAGAVAVVAGLVAALADLSALAIVAGAAGAVAAGLALDLSRQLRTGPAIAERPDTPLLVDGATGLFIEAYFDASLHARVATARRVLRPLSVGFVEVVDVDEAGETIGLTDLAGVRDAVLATLREADMAFTVRGGRLGLLLEDTPEDGAVWTVERVRRAIGTDERGRRLWAGLASYPSHGLTSDELAETAMDALVRAKEWSQDRIEVAEV